MKTSAAAYPLCKKMATLNSGSKGDQSGFGFAEVGFSFFPAR